MALHYEGGRLVRAVTRGDGVRGDDVTPTPGPSVRSRSRCGGTTAAGARGARRGLLPALPFEAMNREREEAEEEPFANPRNAAAAR